MQMSRRQVWRRTFPNVRRLVTHVDQTWDAGLHLERHFILRNSCLDLGIAESGGFEFIQRVDDLNRIKLHIFADTCGTLDVQDGIAHGVKLHTLKLAWQDAG